VAAQPFASGEAKGCHGVRFGQWNYARRSLMLVLIVVDQRFVVVELMGCVTGSLSPHKNVRPSKGERTRLSAVLKSMRAKPFKPVSPVGRTVMT
jgi:hypothetical protein